MQIRRRELRQAANPVVGSFDGLEEEVGEGRFHGGVILPSVRPGGQAARGTGRPRFPVSRCGAPSYNPLMPTNKLNDLDSKTWLKFQKSWFIHNPPPRKKGTLVHPAKFPETMAQEFIEFFTKRGQAVLDPMAGTGSTLVAALRAGRNSYGVELNSKYAEIAKQIIADERASLGSQVEGLKSEIINGDASQITNYQLPTIDYVLTSPPYWDMLRARGAETQKKRRASADLDVFYSDDPNDLGNVDDYESFLAKLVDIYVRLKPLLREKAYLTIIVKNVKKGGKIYPLAWDIARELGKTYTLKDEKIWMQDNQSLAPYGLGSAWVSNTFHHYCLQFRNETGD
ncbi:MAG: site-specific DNA-methyltransferase [Chloroflexi bacterium]|nr:site-specific DNA-methyltransferase [Anaerolineae bacterium]MBL1172662.1 site-specific DNA-methyltransferase [Chloroflexota bacterium]MDL1925155.1 site-specific DNA-methyltransferase [Anaerolineae bacterium AMX1]